jgi:hypothetical protein
MALMIVSLGVLVAACGPVKTTALGSDTYSISFTVSGLTSGTVTVADTDSKASMSSGNTSTSVTLETGLASSTMYSITLASPTGQSCTFSSTSVPSGTLNSDIVLAITCAAVVDYSVGVTVSGLTSGSISVSDTTNKNSLSTGATTTAVLIDPSLPAGTAYTLTFTQPTGATCAFSNASLTTPTTISGTISATSPANVVQPIVCTETTYPVNVSVSGLVTGTTITVADTGNSAIVSLGNANGVLETLAYGKSYSVALTAPSNQTCVFATNSGASSGTITAAVSLVVTCSAYTPIALNSPGGMIFDNSNNLYVANGGATGQVLIYHEGGTAAAPTLTQTGNITTGVNSPSRLAFDTTGTYLYVANIGNNTVTVYQPSSANPNNVLATITNVPRPLGIAVDQNGIVYVGNNSNNTITIYTPVSSTNPASGYGAGVVLSQDGAGNSFLAPGALMFSTFAGQYDGLFIGLGPGGSANNVFLYQTPLTATSKPTGTLTNNSCSSGPNGPTGIATRLNSFPVSAIVFVATYYTSGVTGYNLQGLSSIMTNTGGCPTPAFTSGSSSGISQPEGLAVDAQFGDVYVANPSSNSITVYTASFGAPLNTFH